MRHLNQLEHKEHFDWFKIIAETSQWKIGPYLKQGGPLVAYHYERERINEHNNRWDCPPPLEIHNAIKNSPHQCYILSFLDKEVSIMQSVATLQTFSSHVLKLTVWKQSNITFATTSLPHSSSQTEDKLQLQRSRSRCCNALPLICCRKQGRLLNSNMEELGYLRAQGA